MSPAFALIRIAAALAMFGSATGIAALAADRFLKRADLAVRLVATLICGFVLASVGFHALRLAGRFEPITATTLAAVAAFVCRAQVASAWRRLERRWRLLRHSGNGKGAT